MSAICTARKKLRIRPPELSDVAGLASLIAAIVLEDRPRTAGQRPNSNPVTTVSTNVTSSRHGTVNARRPSTSMLVTDSSHGNSSPFARRPLVEDSVLERKV